MASATPSLKLTMLPLAERQTYGVPEGADESIIRAVEFQSSREDRCDQLRKMIAQEEKDGYKCCDYLSFYSPSSAARGSQSPLPRKSPESNKNINETCRAAICEWMYRVIDYFSVDREVVSIAMSYVDRILSTNYCEDRRTFKLIASTSLHLAIKAHFPNKWQDVGMMLPDLSRGDFVMEDMLAMESELVHSLTWLLNPSTPQNIALYILSLLPPDSPDSVVGNITNTTLFLIELSVCDYFFVAIRKSIVAIAAVLNATETLGFDPYDFRRDLLSCQDSRHRHVEQLLLDIDYHVDWFVVSLARERLWSLYKQSGESNLQQKLLSVPKQEQESLNHSSHSVAVNSYPSPSSCISPIYNGDDIHRFSCSPPKRKRYDGSFHPQDSVSVAYSVGNHHSPPCVDEPAHLRTLTAHSL